MTATTTSIPWASELATLAHRHSGQIAVQDAAGCLTYTDLHAQALALAAVLQEELGSTRRVGVLLHNGASAVVADYAVSIIGACIVHLNPAYSTADLEWCAHIAPFDLLVTEPSLAGNSRGLPMRKLMINETATPATPAGCPAPPAADGNAEARIIFTSGSSGKPKAVVYCHQKRWLAATVLRSVLPYRPDAHGGIALMTPYVHGASNLARAYLDCGSRAILTAGIDHESLRSGLENREIDAIFAPPSVLLKISEAFAGRSFKHVRCIYTGTQPLPASLYKRATAIFGPCVRITYGKSENLNPITLLDPTETEAVHAAMRPHAGSCVGYPGPGVELKLSDSGEILLRSQHEYDGYLSESGFHRHAPGDWQDTGDLGYFDTAGRLWLQGRSSDVINTGGYMVNPDEIESALSALHAVKELCIVSIPSDHWTEIIACVYVPRQQGFDPATSFAPALAGITKYKRPRLYLAMDSIDRTPAGKVNRRALREKILGEYALMDGPYPSLSPHAAPRPLPLVRDG